MKQVIAPVISNTKITSSFYQMWLEAPQIVSEAKPGQFVMVHCGSDTVLPRPLSIHRLDGSRLALLFTVVGKGTAWLAQRRAGDSINILGPLGNGFSIHSASQKLLMVAGGMGIAPLYFMAQEALKKELSVTLLYGTAVKNPYPEDHLTPGIKLITATEDGSVGHHGLVTDLLPEFTDWADQVFVCGPMSMYREMALKKKEFKLEGKPVQVSLEVRMGCGRGVCYGCTIKTKNGLKKVCQDGPVFDRDDILWDELNY